MNAPVKRAFTPQPVGRLALLGFLLLQSIACFGAMPAWEFDANNDRLGWGIPAGLTGAVIGGSLWLTPSPPLERSPAQLASLLYQAGGEWLLGTGIFATGEGPDTRKNHGPATVQPLLANIVSPGGLNIRSPAQSDRQLQVRLRVLNLSMATDFQLKWRSASTAPDDWISRRCGLKPDLKQWQDITCFVDRSWTDTLDQIALGISANLVRGDIWIDSIRIEAGPVEPVPMRPDMVSERVIPRISVPGLSQAHFADAFKVLDETLVVQVPAYGFNYPYHKASGDDRFTDCWWQTDTSINAHAAAWVNQAFAENVARGFGEVQSYGPDGRLPIFPLDPMSGQPGDLSMNPLAFVQFAYGTATRTRDPVLRAQIYRTLKGFLDWFLSSAKRDQATGLVTGTFEEATDPPSSQEETGFSYVQTRAPVSLNVAVAVGAFLLADLAENLGQAADAARYRRVFQDLKNAINTLLWDGKEGRYYDYDLGKKQMLRYRGAGTFLTLFLKIASADQRERVIRHLLDAQEFSRGKSPLPLLAMDEHQPQSRLHPNGAVYFTPLTYMAIVRALEDSDHHDLAAELNWSVLQATRNYDEWLPLNPDANEPDRSPRPPGKRYGDTAAYYIIAVLEHLFGVNYDAAHRRIAIQPHVPKALYGKDLTLENLTLPTDGGTKLSVHVRQSSMGTATIAIRIDGKLPDEMLEVTLPGTGKTRIIVPERTVTAVFP